MGVVSVAVTKQTEAGVRIAIFVLSCRVFGYGVETALLNVIRRSAALQGQGRSIEGSYLETAHNEPCRRFYPDNGFVWEPPSWIDRGGPNAADPDWLTVEVHDLEGVAVD